MLNLAQFVTTQEDIAIRVITDQPYISIDYANLPHDENLSEKIGSDMTQLQMMRGYNFMPTIPGTTSVTLVCPDIDNLAMIHLAEHLALHFEEEYGLRVKREVLGVNGFDTVRKSVQSFVLV